ncbi:MAG: YodL domain-containing protein [Streptococcus sp.]
MDINQFAVYQLKNGPETRQMRFRSYEKLQQSGIQVRYEYYREVYLGKMRGRILPKT